MKYNSFFLIIIMIITSCSSAKYNHSREFTSNFNPIIFEDTTYPLIDLKLSDVADLEFIELEFKYKHKDYDYDLTQFDNDIYFDEKHIYIDFLHELYKFDLNGNIIKSKIKESDANLNHFIMEFDFFSKNRLGIRYLYSRNIVINNSNFKDKREVNNQLGLKRISLNNKKFLSSISNPAIKFRKTKDNLPANYNILKITKKVKKRNMIIDSTMLEEPYIKQPSHINLFVYGLGGIFIQDIQNENNEILWYDTNTKETYPRLIDKSTDDKNIGVIAENSDYVFFNRTRGLNACYAVESYVYDKNQKKNINYHIKKIN